MNELQAKWPVMVDLFATSLNCRLPVYFSPFNDPMAAGTDAFHQSWDGLQAYAFPLFALIRKVISKLRTSKGMLLTVVASFWSQKEWSPDLLNLSMAPSVTLPYRTGLLKQPHFHHLHQNLHVLHLHVWRLSSDVLDT